MKWVSISNSNALIHEYHLVHNEACILTVKYNPLHRSVRIHGGMLHKLFFIESTGSLTGKYQLKNEYDMVIGNMNHNKWMGRDGSVEIDSKKYTYKLGPAHLPAITIYSGTDEQPAITCSLSADHHGNVFHQENSAANNCLLLSLCWFLATSIKTSQVLEHAY